MAEPLNATFFLFRKRAQGGVILRATLGFVAVCAVLVAIFAALTWGAWAGLFNMIGQAGRGQVTNDPTPVFGIFAIVGWGIILSFGFYVAMAAYEAACLKWMIRGEVGGFLGLNADADMWRVYGGYWMWFVVNLAVSIGASMLMAPIFFMVMPIMIRSAQTGVPDLTAFWILQIVGSLLQWLPIGYFALRFAPGNATSLATKKFAYFDAWKVTRGRVLPLLGSFALLWAIWLVLNVLLWLVVAAGLLMQLLPALWRMFTSPSTADVQAVTAMILAPQNLIPIGIGYAILALGGAVLAATFMGVNARAVIAAAEDGKIDAILPDSVAKTFE